MQALLSVLVAKTVYLSAAKAGGPTVLIISPGVHTSLVAFLNGCSDVVEPFISHILGSKTASRVHKVATDACLVHNADLSLCLFGIELFIPRPEGYGTVFFVYVLKIHGYSPKIIFSSLAASIFFLFAFSVTVIFSGRNTSAATSRMRSGVILS